MDGRGPGQDQIERRLDWLRHVESLDEHEARRRLRARLRADAELARREVPTLTPWASMTPTVRDMLARDAELVRLHRIVRSVPAGARILDVGCGPGVVAGTLALHHTPGAYLGIDLSEPKVHSARDMADANGLASVLRFEVADATELPAAAIAELAPDVVLVLEVLEHLQDPAAVLASLAELVSPDARITFSVPILGRIEACWGHRTLYGADAIVGLAAECGFTVLDVDEVHNTWALATVSRSGADGSRPADVRPITVRHLTAPQLVASEVEPTVLTAPSRLHLTLTPGRTARIDAATPGADWVRVDVGVEPAGALGGAEVTTLDADGNVVRRWTPTVPSDRTTMVFRPRDAATMADGTAATTRLQFTATEAAEVDIWRLGFASGYDGLHRPPTRPVDPPRPEHTRGPLRAAPFAIVRRLIRRWPRLGPPLAAARRRIRSSSRRP